MVKRSLMRVLTPVSMEKIISSINNAGKMIFCIQKDENGPLSHGTEKKLFEMTLKT